MILKSHFNIKFLLKSILKYLIWPFGPRQTLEYLLHESILVGFFLPFQSPHIYTGNSLNCILEVLPSTHSDSVSDTGGFGVGGVRLSGIIVI